MAGGGTGGHLFPALALAEELKQRDKDVEIIFAGAERGIEAKVIPARGYRLELFDIEGVKKRTGKKRLNAIFKAIKGTFEAIKRLKEIKPDGVIGSGGYSSGPIVLAAWLLGIKTAILEQNALPGFTNKILGHVVKRVYVAFEEAESFFPKGKTVLTGTPVRKDILRAAKESETNGTKKKKEKFSIFVFGGSQGATAINAAFLDATEYLTDIWNSLSVTHQSGEEGFEVAKESYQRKNMKVHLEVFIEDMASAYKTSDLVICRAGATTIAEITSFGLASILVPYPFSTDNHQKVNARSLEKKGVSILIMQDELTGSTLALAIRKFFDNRAGLERVRDAAKKLSKPEAAGHIVDDFLELLDKG